MNSSFSKIQFNRAQLTIAACLMFLAIVLISIGTSTLLLNASDSVSIELAEKSENNTDSENNENQSNGEKDEVLNYFPHYIFFHMEQLSNPDNASFSPFNPYMDIPTPPPEVV